MPDQNEKPAANEPGMPISAESIGFSADDLVACPKCTKPNGPDRNSCIYCGGDLPQTDLNADGSVQPVRDLELWEPAVNLIVLPAKPQSTESISSASHLLGLSGDGLIAIMESNTPLPIARVAPDQVQSASGRLRDLGFDIREISDAELSADHPPVRIRSAELKDGGILLEDFNTHSRYTINADGIVLIVTGRIYESRRDEVTRRKRGAVKVLDEFETGGDLGVVDIYSADDAQGFRVQANGFDFSILEEEKEMLADKNLAKFVSILERQFPNAIIADEYDPVRSKLDMVWEPEVIKDFRGLQMRGFGKREFDTTFTSTNVGQFTKYSRMRRLTI